MKKTFLLLFSLILVVSLSACGAKTTRGPKANYVYSFEEEPSLEKGE